MTDTKPARASYDDLRDRRAFQSRHIGPTSVEIAEMLAAVGVAGMDELIDRTVPDDVRQREPMKLPKLGPRQTDYDELREMARSNRKVVSMLGMGYHQTITPAVIRRNVFENPGWYTAYTPYQPEISQGRLEALLNFQTMVCELTAMDLANASLLDESTAAAESMTLLHRVGRGRKGDRFVVDEACHPQTVAVVETRAEPIGLDGGGRRPGHRRPRRRVRAAGAVSGHHRGRPRPALHHRAGPRLRHAGGGGRRPAVAVRAHPRRARWAPTWCSAPTQRFGVPIGFGGPHAAYFAVREEFQRSLPGRLVGVSRDSAGRQALRLALQTREQHIRREKATSNICTSQVLLAVMASMYAIHHGPEGLARIAGRVNRVAAILAQGLRENGVEIVHDEFFDTVCARVPGRADKVIAVALAGGVNLRRVDADTVAASVDEATTARRPRRGVAGVRLQSRLPHPGPPSRRPAPGRLPAHHPGAVASDLLGVPQRDRVGALHAPAGQPRHRPGPVDDPAGLVHDEAQRGHRDGAGELARAGRHPPVRPRWSRPSATSA